MKPSGKPITRAPFLPASRIRRQAFSVEPSRSRKTDAAWTAATLTTGYWSPMSGRQAVPDLHVLGLELEPRRSCLLHEQLREVFLGHARAHHRLDQVARDRGERHRHLEFAPGLEAQVEVLPQQVRREGDVEVEVDERGRLVAGEGRAHDALVEELEEGVARNARLLGEH